MVTRDMLYVLDYYKRNIFMGSSDKLYFRIYKVEEKKEANGEEEKMVPLLEAVCWPGPFIFSKTAEEEKTYRRFPYSDDGLEQIAAWLNEEHDKLEEI